MSLRIGHLNTTCHLPEQLRRGAELVERMARGRFARDLGEHLGPSLARQPAIVRIRRLRLRVIIPASQLNEDSLSLAWKQAFGKALFTALAYPTGAGPFEVFRAESLASFLASAICDLLDGTAATKWQYAEFEAIFRRGGAQAALALICEWPRHSMGVLMELAEHGVLDHLLARFDDLAMERLFTLLSSPSDTEPPPLSVPDLIAAAKLALAHPPEKPAALRSRAYALSLFVEACKGGRPPRSPRALFHALLALAVLLSEELFWPGIQRSELWAQRLPPSVTAILEVMGRSIHGEMNWPFSADGRSSPPMPGGAASPQIAELDRILASLRAKLNVPPPSNAPAEARWITSDWCGMFFLIGSLARLGWTSEWRKLPEFQMGGVACLVAGTALAVTGKFEADVRSLDPGIALFAGYVSEPDIAHLRRVFQEFPREARLSVLRAALPDEAEDDPAETWELTFERLADALLRDFASQIRGFRQATRQGIVRSFIARRGRIRIDPQRILVSPGPSPFNVALHVSGMDAPIEAGSWLGRRRVEFELGDL